ncbi:MULTISPECIES: CHC2 zinc finger domain-containing protein [unclassified Duganella]|uniref:CHC2 zinc finger domain-containing protein n=1 Tax=unclassified Duganella TaxID=2636909 RepID=UPI0009EB28A2|nr:MULTISPECIES: CHC2 zinc finger domain-containing protein [unclassified Duganella]
MPRIPDADIERLKNEVAVERLVESAGIALKKSGKDRIGTCPFHEDGEPSLVVTPAKNLWHCFGCQIGGGPIDWVMKLRGVSFRHAVELLKADPALAAQGVQAPVKYATVRSLPAPVGFDVDEQALLNQVAGYYAETLKQSPEALAYLQSRGLDHPELVAHFKLGYANRTLGLRLPEKNRKAGAEIRSQLEKVGVYRESGHEHFNGSLVVPIMDADGNVSEMYGRKITDGLRKGTPLHLYLPGPHRGVWNVAALAASPEIILCESLIDAMTFWCAGYRNVTASYGVEGFTDDHLAAFKGHGTKRVLIAYDRDDAGERAADRLAERLIAAGIDCYRIQFPKGMDANEYALKVQPTSKSLGALIRKAVWMGSGQAPAIAMTQAPAPSVTVPPLAAKEEPAPLPPAAPLPASPAPSGPSFAMDADVKDNEVVLAFAERRYRVRGLSKNLAYDVLKVNVLASNGDAFHVDTFDLYNARARASYITQAAMELRVAEDTLKTDLGRVLLKLEALQEQQIQGALKPKEPEAVTMDASEREAALSLLMAPDLLTRIADDFNACGIVGEATNKLVGYLAATSRRLDAPLAIVIQSSSAAGKSSLMDAVLAMMPAEERVKYSAMTGQSLFYMGETNLKHKILAIVEEEGASRASYALKLLQSEGELTIATTGADPKTGNLVTQEYRVEGPVMMFLTTTAIDIDEELMNRCLVLTVDEDREQTRAIHRLQREKRTLQGLVRKEQKQRILDLHRNAQRLLKKLAVVNPYADQLTFLDDRTRTRRDHEKYLTLIDTIALLHQHQRPVKRAIVAGQSIEYIEVTLADIEAANRLAHEVLGRSLDELPPQTRRVLAALHGWVLGVTQERQQRRADVRFTRSDVRRLTSLSDTQCCIHIERLIALEYVLVHRGTRGQSFEYELLYDGSGDNGAPFVVGLIGVDALKSNTTTTSSRGQTGQFTGSSRPHHGGDSVPLRCVEPAGEPASTGPKDESGGVDRETHRLGADAKIVSYPHLSLAAAAVSAG